MIHREVLVSKSVPIALSETLSKVVNVVNLIKANPLKSRIFTELCDAMNADHKCLLFHTDVRWLSKGKVLNRVVALKSEVISYFDCYPNQDFECVKDELWWLRVSFLADLFQKLNVLNLSLQGEKENILTISGKIKSFVEKINLWIIQVGLQNVEFLPTVDLHQRKSEIFLEIKETMEKLRTSFNKYFPNIDISKFEWILQPFSCDTTKTGLSFAELENLIDVRNDVSLKSRFTEDGVSKFWISIKHLYPDLSKKAVKSLLPFGSSYLCEYGFSALTEIKSKKRGTLLMVDEEMRVCLSKINPRLEVICAQKQAHPSH
jgi:hypothetical protein